MCLLQCVNTGSAFYILSCKYSQLRLIRPPQNTEFVRIIQYDELTVVDFSCFKLQSRETELNSFFVICLLFPEAIGSGDTEEDLGDVIVTGVVIYQSLHSTLSTDLSLYFGCELASKSRGGSGWLWMSRDRNSTTVTQLLSGGHPVWAGVLQLSTSVTPECDSSDDGGGGGGGGGAGVTNTITYNLLLVCLIFGVLVSK